MSMDSDCRFYTQAFATTFGVIFLAIFLGVFFGITYPEIAINKDSRQTSCLIINSTISSAYCPSLSCTSCSDSIGLQSCGSIHNYLTSFSPTKCSANNTAECPPSQMQCSNGYHCCETCCQTCTSCSTSCSSSGSVGDESHNDPPDNYQLSNYPSYKTGLNSSDDSFISSGCTTSCVNYPCNCVCCSSVNNLLCSYTENICYTADLDIAYDTITDQPVNTRYDQSFGTDLSGVENYINNVYQVDHSYTCYYDISDLSVIRWDISYNSTGLIVSGFFGSLALICLTLGLFALFVKDMFDFCIGSVIWTGLIELIILVPILQTAPLSKTGTIVLTYFICQLAVIEFIPATFYIDPKVGLFYLLTIYPAIGIAVPSNLYIANNAEFFSLTIIMSIIAFSILVSLLYLPRYCIKSADAPPSYDVAVQKENITELAMVKA